MMARPSTPSEEELLKVVNDFITMSDRVAKRDIDLKQMRETIEKLSALAPTRLEAFMGAIAALKAWAWPHQAAIAASAPPPKLPPVVWEEHHERKGKKDHWTHATATWLGSKLRIERRQLADGKIVSIGSVDGQDLAAHKSRMAARSEVETEARRRHLAR